MIDPRNEARDTLRSKLSEWDKNMIELDAHAILDRAKAIHLAKLRERNEAKKKLYKRIILVSCMLVILFSITLAFDNARAYVYGFVVKPFANYEQISEDSVLLIPDGTLLNTLASSNNNFSYYEYNYKGILITLAKEIIFDGNSFYNDNSDIKKTFTHDLRWGKAYCSIDNDGHYFANITSKNILITVIAVSQEASQILNDDMFIEILEQIEF